MSFIIYFPFFRLKSTSLISPLAPTATYCRTNMKLLFSTPLAACIYKTNLVKPREALAALYILRESWDMTEEIDADLLRVLAETASCMLTPKGYEAVLTTTFDSLCPEIKEYIMPTQAHDILWFGCHLGHPNQQSKETIQYLLGLLRDFINTPDDHGYKLLHKTVAAYIEATTALVVNGAELHVLGENREYTNRRETPTSLAIRSSIAFSAWKRALRVANIELTSFVQEEMKTEALGELGWSTSALLELFSLEFQAYEHDYTEKCAECEDCLRMTCVVEPQWLDRIEEIRLRHSQANEMFSTPSAMTPVEDILNTDMPIDSCQNQNYKDAELPDDATVDDIDLRSDCSSRDSHSAASRTNDSENRQYEEISEDNLDEPYLLCWHCWHIMYESSDSSHNESDQESSDEQDSPFLFPI
jgi:hypothetical protein